MLSQISISHFRCLQHVELPLHAAFTFISGPNASGKTSLLEAIHLLGRGRSFRTRRLERLVERGFDRFVLYGEIRSRGATHSLGIEGSGIGLRARIDGRAAAGLIELASALPTQIIDPEVHKLIEEGPGRRRRFLDWGVFHVEPSFISHWQRFQTALKQRNAALKNRQPRGAVTIWDSELVQSSEFITAARQRYVDALLPRAAELGARLLVRDVSLRYRAGWNQEQPFADALLAGWESDRERGSTQSGPQRAELNVLVDGLAAKDHISRGQQKLLASALLLAQLKLFATDSDRRPVLLLDDPAAELDASHLARLLEEIRTLPVQLVVTSLTGDFAAFGTPDLQWRIESGKLLPAAG